MGQEKYPSQRKNGDKNVEGSVPKARNMRMLLSGRNHCDLTVKPSARNCDKSPQQFGSTAE